MFVKLGPHASTTAKIWSTSAQIFSNLSQGEFDTSRPNSAGFARLWPTHRPGSHRGSSETLRGLRVRPGMTLRQLRVPRLPPTERPELEPPARHAHGGSCRRTRSDPATKSVLTLCGGSSSAFLRERARRSPLHTITPLQRDAWHNDNVPHDQASAKCGQAGCPRLLVGAGPPTRNQRFLPPCSLLPFFERVPYSMCPLHVMGQFRAGPDATEPRKKQTNSGRLPDWKPNSKRRCSTFEVSTTVFCGCLQCRRPWVCGGCAPPRICTSCLGTRLLQIPRLRTPVLRGSSWPEQLNACVLLYSHMLAHACGARMPSPALPPFGAGGRELRALPPPGPAKKGATSIGAAGLV